MKTSTVEPTLSNGSVAEAQAPLIISASKATGIHSFYSGRFFNQIRQWHIIRWYNPDKYNHSYMSFANTKFIAFWSPLLKFSLSLHEMDTGYPIQ